MASRFEIEVLTRFRSAGLNQIASEARAAVNEIAKVGGVRAPGARSLGATGNVTRQEATTAAIRAANEELTAARNDPNITGSALARRESRIRGRLNDTLATIERIFAGLDKDTKEAAGKIKASADKVGAALTGDEAIANAGGRPVFGNRQDILNQAALDQATERRLARAAVRDDPAQQAARDAEVAAARREARNAQARQLGVYDPNATEQVTDARIAAKQRIDADLQAARVARLRASGDQELGVEARAAAGERRRAERELAVALRKEARQEVLASIGRGEGTRFQRLQARFQGSTSNKMPEDFQGFAQVVATRAVSTLGFAIAGSVLYGATRAIGTLLEESEKLQVDLNQIGAQLKSIGDESSFERATDGILNIARATGVASDEVAKVFQQFRGAFGTRETQDGLDGTARALRETASAMKIVQVTGLSLAEVIDSLTATALTFDVSISSIGDTAIGLQERFGVLANQTITFVADLAPVADEIGLSVQDLASLGAVAQQVSGKAGAALAEGFNRILPTIQNLQSEILQLYQLPQLQGKRGDILAAFAQGNTGDVFKRLVRDYDSLSSSQQKYVISLLGGRREAQVLIPVLQNASKLTAEWDANQQNLGRDSGKLSSYFDDLKSTVQNAQQRLSESFKQLGQALFASGLGEFLATAANSANGLVGALGFVVQTIGELNQAVKGIPYIGEFLDIGQLASILLLMSGVTKAVGVLGSVLKANAAAEAADTAATELNTTSKAGKVVATQAEIAAMAEEKAALIASGLAEDIDTASTEANTVAKTGNAASRFAGALPSFLGGVGPAVGPASAIGIPVAASAIVAGKYLSERDKVARAREDAAARLKDLTTEELKRQYNEPGRFAGGDQGPGITGLRDFLFGGKTPKQLYEEEINRRDALDPGKVLTAIANQRREYISKLVDIANSDQNRQALDDLYARDVPDNSGGVLGSGIGPDLGPDLTGGGAANAVQASLVASFRNAKTPDEQAAAVQNIVNAAQESGSKFLTDFLVWLRGLASTSPEIQAIIDGAVKDQQQQDAEVAAGGKDALALSTYKDIKAKFEAGAVGASTYAAGLRSSIAQLKERRRIGGGAFDPLDPAGDPAVELAQEERDYQDYIDKRTKSLADAVTTAQRATLSPRDFAAANLQSQIAALSTSSPLSLRAKIEKIPEALAALSDNFQKELDSIKDPVAKARRALEGATTGVEIPDEIKTVFVAGQLGLNEKFDELSRELASLTGQDLDSLVTAVAQTVATTNQSVQQALLAQIDQAIARIQLLLGGDARAINLDKDIAALQAIRNRATGGSPGVSKIPGIGAALGAQFGTPQELGGNQKVGDAQAAQDSLNQAAQAQEQAYLALEKAQANGDPVRLAELAIREAEIMKKYARLAGDQAGVINAEAQRVEAVNQLQAAQDAITVARINLAAAQAGDDPVAQAEAQIQLAYQAIATAHGLEAQLNAQAALKQAQDSLAKAQQDVTQAWLESQVALFTIIGDSVKAAEVALYAAVIRMNDAINNKEGDAAIIRATTAVKEAESQVTESIISETESQIQTDLELERITRSEAVARLKALRATVVAREHTQKELDDIDKMIKQMQDQLGQDFAFNIPSQIDLPTLYEVRRTKAVGRGGLDAPQTYQDNRTVQVGPITVSSEVDADKLIGQITDVVGAPPRNGPRLGAY